MKLRKEQSGLSHFLNKIPQRALSNHEIINIILCHAPSTLREAFQGVFSRDEIPSEDSGKKLECAIFNLSSRHERGTHWVAYFKVQSLKHVLYYDSFGNLPPPKELFNKFRGYTIFFNRSRNQAFNTQICGLLCLRFLYKMSCKYSV
jgi:hypothetical protein